MTHLALTNVVVGYDTEPVLRAISLDVPEGALLAIVGPSGCGKTTLLRTIAGLVPARSGEIRLGRRMVTTHGIHLAPEKRRIGWVPQDAALFPHLTVAENVAFGLGTRRKSAIGGVRGAARKAARSERVQHLLALVGLTAFADRLPAQLSGGQAQRVALARALAGVPDVVLLDEPFGALDPQLRAELRTEVRALLRTEGMTGILVTHDQSEALSVADYVAVMREGEILQFGRPDEVYRRPATPWVASFVGEAVFLPGVWAGGAVHCALGRLDADWVAGPPHAGAVDAPGEQRTAGGSAETEGAAVTVLVRPEEIEIGPVADVSVAGGAARTATVAGVSYTGHDAMLELFLDDGRSILSRVTAAELRPAGARVSVRVRGRVLAYPETHASPTTGTTAPAPRPAPGTPATPADPGTSAPSATSATLPTAAASPTLPTSPTPATPATSPTSPTPATPATSPTPATPATPATSPTPATPATLPTLPTSATVPTSATMPPSAISATPSTSATSPTAASPRLD